MTKKHFLTLFLIIPFFGMSQHLLDSIQGKIEEKFNILTLHQRQQEYSMTGYTKKPI
ncbi:hypothetical protein OAX11_04435 [Flavobacteriaceae bacterium]|nr:hypothetical protein [Flavobacteriaceae bacterium]